MNGSRFGNLFLFCFFFLLFVYIAHLHVAFFTLFQVQLLVSRKVTLVVAFGFLPQNFGWYGPGPTLSFCPRLLPLLPMASWKIRAFSLCMVFTSSQLSRAVPHGTKGTSPEFVTRPVYSRSQLQEQHEHYRCSSSTDAFISYSIYTVRRYRTSPGAPDLRARLG